MLHWDLRRPVEPAAALQLSSEPCFALACVADKAQHGDSAAGDRRAACAAVHRDSSDCGAENAPPGDLAGRACQSPAHSSAVAIGRSEAGGAEGVAEPAGAAPPCSGAKTLSVIAGGANSEVTWLALDATAGALHRKRACALAQEGVGDVCVRGDGRIAAVGTWEGTVRLYHARRAKQLAVLKHHKRSVAAVAFKPGAGMLASGGRDGVIALWSVFDDA